MSEGASWYYARGDTPLGPVSRETLEMLARRGELRPSDLVWTEGMVDWAPASAVLGPVWGGGGGSAGVQGSWPLGYAQGPQDRSQRTLAILAIVFGVLSLTCCPVIFGVVGVVCGIVARSKDGPDRDLATVGLVVSIVGLVLGSVGCCAVFSLNVGGGGA
ncbi:MAG: DUF4339 domain-containing protein [Tepidisphaerales bacterium]